jgi:hypothetical protein
VVITVNGAGGVREATDSRKLRTRDGGGAAVITAVSLGDARNRSRHHAQCRSDARSSPPSVSLNKEVGVPAA